MTELPRMGASLPVPRVQELAEAHLQRVPPRYVREDQEPKVTIDSSDSLIPIIDMEKLLQDDEAELQRLHCACKEWGFFQLINHGVSTCLIEKMKSEAVGLFRLSSEEKNKLAQRPGDLEGFGQAFVVSEDQTLDWCDMFYLVNMPPHLRNPYLSENLSPSIRECILAYGTELKKVATTVLRQMERALEMKENEMAHLFEDVYQGIRINYYPPCPQPEFVAGISPHSDGTGVTLVLQVKGAQGLEIRREGKWVPVEPIPNAFIVNIGDMLEMITNGVYRSILHRATVDAELERISIATFNAPKLSAEIGPSPSLVSGKEAPIYKYIMVEEFIKQFLSRELKGKSFLETMLQT